MSSVTYDPKIGFTKKSPTVSDSASVFCEIKGEPKNFYEMIIKREFEIQFSVTFKMLWDSSLRLAVVDGILETILIVSALHRKFSFNTRINCIRYTIL